ncbi:MAG: LPS-assembly protein LptD, partial [Planctomycetota bacterium]
LPIHYSAERVTSRIVNGKRITIARGKVYLSQGSPKSALFLELRSQAAVLFTEKIEKPKAARTPISPKMGRPGEETITAVYLEGDVVIARGERHLRADRAYFDFLTDRAYVPNAVFRTVQEQRNIPIYIRAQEARALSARELYFRNAKVTTSDFYSPSYHIGVSEAYVMDATPYDREGVQIGSRSWLASMKHATFNIRSIPVAYVPFWKGDLEEGHSPLRTASIGSHGDFGFGVETEWHLFRLLGLVRPKDVRAFYELNWYEEGVLTGVRFHYARQNELRRYAGYGRVFGLFAGGDDDDFGDRRQDISAPRTRGRAMWRHKEYLPQDWSVQMELSYLCDRNFLERYWPTEFYAGKEQETLIYAKKQRDNWAFTALAKHRLNRFETQDEAAPDLGFYLIGEPLLGDRLTLFSESHVGLRRFRPANDSPLESSDMMGRFDTREEIDLPLHIGPVTVVPYAVGRLTCWTDRPADGEKTRPYGQVGARASTSIWRAYGDVSDVLWDINGLRHIITPELAVFLSDTGGVSPDELFPLDPDVEEHLRRANGFSAGIYQRLQTKRGPAENRHTVDWMRLAVVAGFYDNGPDLFPGDGRFYLYQPEYSLGRNHVNVDYSWYISDSTTFLADLNWDTDRGSVRRAAAGLSVVRSPRLGYYAGMRLLPDMDSAIGTFGARYRINRKYSVSLFEQYDFDFRGKRNLATSLSIVRKLPRWYAALTFTFDQSDEGNNFNIVVAFWPEGIPEVRIGGSRSTLLTKSLLN